MTTSTAPTPSARIRAPGGRAPGAVVGAWPLLRLALRRDRVRLPVWLIGITTVCAVSANAVLALYDTAEKRAGYAATVEGSTITRLMGGVPRDADTIGGILSIEITAVAAVAVALMISFLVVRHTRSEEETGRAELVRSTVTGRHSALLAAVVLAAAASLAIGLLLGTTVALAGVEASASVLFGAGMSGVGMVFTGVAAIAAQVASAARRALGISLAVLLLGYLLRGCAAIGETWLTWASPFGWQDELRPFGADARWWPLALSLAAAGLNLAAAAWLAAHRDFGAGLVAERTGAARASRWITTPRGLAFHQQRGLLAGWGTGLVLTAAIFGAMGREVRTMVESNPEIAQILGGEGDDLVRGYLAYVMSFLGVVVSAYAVVSALRLRHSELVGQAETLLSTGVSRTVWARSGIETTLVCSIAVLLAVGLAASLAHAAVSGDTDLVPSLLGASLGTAPAVLLLASVVIALHGWAPRWTLLGWVPVAWAFIQAYLGELLDVPRWLSGLSPFEHLPAMPVESFAIAPALVLTAMAVALTLLGVVGLRRRDLD